MMRAVQSAMGSALGSALGWALVVGLAACASDAASEERASREPAPVSEAKPAPASETKPAMSAVAGTDADKKSEGDKKTQRLGLDLQSDKPFNIDARSAELVDDGQGGESMRFRGNVTLVQDDLKLTCDRLDAFFPKGRGQGGPQTFTASGDVQVVKGEFELRCTRAEFERDSCIAVCLSSETCQSSKWPEKPARFRRGKDWIEGRELEFNQCTGKMVARCGARVQVAPGAGAGSPAGAERTAEKPKADKPGTAASPEKASKAESTDKASQADGDAKPAAPQGARP